MHRPPVLLPAKRSPDGSEASPPPLRQGQLLSARFHDTPETIYHDIMSLLGRAIEKGRRSAMRRTDRQRDAASPWRSSTDAPMAWPP